MFKVFTKDGKTWVKDSNGNTCSVEYFGSLEAAKVALASLYKCYDCTNCSYCYHCRDCINCTFCDDSYENKDCSYCSFCNGCTNCVNCHGKEEKENITKNIVVPIIENIHQKLHEAVTATGNLNMNSWHTCKTTHCRGGWIVTLAGKEGKALEKKFDTLLAAMIIYKANGYAINPHKFFVEDEEAMMDIEQLAGVNE